MAHLPYEEWILEPGSLTELQQHDLDAHLTSCDACRGLQQRWTRIEQRFVAAPMAAPAPGFTQRWQSGLAERMERKRRMQASIIALACIIAAILLLSVYAGYQILTLSPGALVTRLLDSIVALIGRLQMIRNLGVSWYAFVPLPIQFAFWLMVTCTLSFLSVTWFAALWRINLSGVNNR